MKQLQFWTITAVIICYTQKSYSDFHSCPTILISVYYLCILRDQLNFEQVLTNILKIVSLKSLPMKSGSQFLIAYFISLEPSVHLLGRADDFRKIFRGFYQFFYGVLIVINYHESMGRYYIMLILLLSLAPTSNPPKVIQAHQNDQIFTGALPWNSFIKHEIYQGTQVLDASLYHKFIIKIPRFRPFWYNRVRFFKFSRNAEKNSLEFDQRHVYENELSRFDFYKFTKIIFTWQCLVMFCYMFTFLFSCRSSSKLPNTTNSRLLVFTTKQLCLSYFISTTFQYISDYWSRCVTVYTFTKGLKIVIRLLIYCLFMNSFLGNIPATLIEDSLRMNCFNNLFISILLNELFKILTKSSTPKKPYENTLDAYKRYWLHSRSALGPLYLDEIVTVLLSNTCMCVSYNYDSLHHQMYLYCAIIFVKVFDWCYFMLIDPLYLVL